MHSQEKDLFASLAHPMRLRTLLLLVNEGELCVCEIMHILELQQPVMSRHLAELKKSGLVESRKQGQWVFYRISDELPDWINNVIHQTNKGVSMKPPYIDDLKAIKQLKESSSQITC